MQAMRVLFGIGVYGLTGSGAALDVRCTEQT